MDGSAKGGGVLSAVAASGSRILFLGTGEKPEDLTAYDPKKFVSTLLGFPDFETLLEKAKEIKVPKELPQKLDYATFIEQLKSMKKMGPLKSIMQMMGVYDIPEEFVGKSEEKLKVFENAYNSMTAKERTETELMKERSRQERVAKGAGLKPDEVKEMVTNFEKINKMMKGFGKNRGLMSKFKNNPQLEKMMKDLDKTG
ncbi:Signal recognition particle 54 kDa protein [uncultured archaeon]|nr:Signal recognition particle 54 kDa protein [uncultured archaeon]